MSEPGAKPDLSVVELRILREHWEWGGRHTIFWIILTILIFGGAPFALRLSRGGREGTSSGLHFSRYPRSRECNLACSRGIGGAAGTRAS